MEYGVTKHFPLSAIRKAQALELEAKNGKEALEAETAAKEALEAEIAAKEALEAELVAKEALEAEIAAKEALEAEIAAKELAEASKKEDVPGNDDNNSGEEMDDAMMDFGLEDDTIGDACAMPELEEDQVCANDHIHHRVH